MDLIKNAPGKVDLRLSRSSRAVCGPQEREVVVRSSNVAETEKLLKSKGFFIVGKSTKGFSTRKIWFNPVGGF